MGMLNNVVAAWLSFAFFAVPQYKYPETWEEIYALLMESKVLPNIPGI